jgi:succinate dehydrogenase / fumarate reductase, membrane anchor subunit
MNGQNKHNHKGSTHWVHHRITAVINVFIMPWFVINMVLLGKTHFVNMLDFLKTPVNAGLITIMLVNVFYHGTLGIQVVIEDYVHNKTIRWASINGLRLLAILFCGAALYSLHHIYNFELN